MSSSSKAAEDLRLADMALEDTSQTHPGSSQLSVQDLRLDEFARMPLDKGQSLHAVSPPVGTNPWEPGFAIHPCPDIVTTREAVTSILSCGGVQWGACQHVTIHMEEVGTTNMTALLPLLSTCPATAIRLRAVKPLTPTLLAALQPFLSGLPLTFTTIQLESCQFTPQALSEVLSALPARYTVLHLFQVSVEQGQDDVDLTESHLTQVCIHASHPITVGVLPVPLVEGVGYQWAEGWEQRVQAAAMAAAGQQLVALVDVSKHHQPAAPPSPPPATAPQPHAIAGAQQPHHPAPHAALNAPPADPIMPNPPVPALPPQANPPAPALPPQANPPAPALPPQANPPAPALQPQANPPAPALQPQANPPAPALQPQANPPAPALQPQANPPAPALLPQAGIQGQQADDPEGDLPHAPQLLVISKKAEIEQAARTLFKSKPNSGDVFMTKELLIFLAKPAKHTQTLKQFRAWYKRMQRSFKRGGTATEEEDEIEEEEEEDEIPKKSKVVLMLERLAQQQPCLHWDGEVLSLVLPALNEMWREHLAQ